MDSTHLLVICVCANILFISVDKTEINLNQNGHRCCLKNADPIKVFEAQNQRLNAYGRQDLAAGTTATSWKLSSAPPPAYLAKLSVVK